MARTKKDSTSTTAKPKTDKRARFTKLATNRTNAVISKIRVLSNCANPASYVYTVKDVTAIFSAIAAALADAKARFDKTPDAKNDKAFTLPE